MEKAGGLLVWACLLVCSRHVTSLKFAISLHLSIVEPPPAALGSGIISNLPAYRPLFRESRFKETQVVYGSAETGRLSIDVLRLRVRVPLTCTVDELRRFVSKRANRTLLHMLQDHVDEVDAYERDYVALVERMREAFLLTGVVLDANLTSNTGVVLPPEVHRVPRTDGERETLMVPHAFGPIIAEHAAEQVRRRFRSVPTLLTDFANARSDDCCAMRSIRSLLLCARRIASECSWTIAAIWCCCSQPSMAWNCSTTHRSRRRHAKS